MHLHHSMLTLIVLLFTVLVIPPASAQQTLTAEIMVTKFTDSNDGTCNADCSLREAVIHANQQGGPDSITLAAGTYTLSLTSADDINITSEITLKGAGRTMTIIQGTTDWPYRIFAITTVGQVMITDVTIHNGDAIFGSGGCILSNTVATVLHLTNVLLSSCESTSPGRGAALSLKGDTTLTDVIMQNNDGEAVMNYGTLVMDDSTIELTTGEALTNSDGTVMMRNSHIHNNATSVGNGVFNAGAAARMTIEGSQIQNNGDDNILSGGIRNHLGTMTISNTLIAGNALTAGSGSGGIWNSGTLTVTESVIRENRGSGVESISGSLTTITATTIISNSASGIFARGRMNLGNSHISANRGSGVIQSSGVVTITQTVIEHNTNGFGSGFDQNGGSAAITDSRISQNTATDSGGGISFSGTIVMTRTEVLSNTARVLGGGIWGTKAASSSVIPQLSLFNSTVSGNQLTGIPSFGGGISTSETILKVVNTTISDNESKGKGGGLYHFKVTATLTNSTISGNHAGDQGGGYYQYGASTTTIAASTIANNQITSDTEPSASIGGGGLWNGSGAIVVSNSIIAGNGLEDCRYTITSAGHNLDSDGTCRLSSSGDQSRAIAALGPLATNGGPTHTHALLAESAALNAANAATCPLTDQRGQPRPLGIRCDSGAFESALSRVFHTFIPLLKR